MSLPGSWYIYCFRLPTCKTAEPRRKPGCPKNVSCSCRQPGTTNFDEKILKAQPLVKLQRPPPTSCDILSRSPMRFSKMTTRFLFAPMILQQQWQRTAAPPPKTVNQCCPHHGSLSLLATLSPAFVVLACCQPVFIVRITFCVV